MTALPRQRRVLATAAVIAGVIARSATAAQAQYVQTNLVSDVPGLALRLDPALSNPWGIAASGTSPFWVSDNNTGLSTLYNGAGVKQALTVAIPGGGPTGMVFNNTGSFALPVGGNATFMFATLGGSIEGWNGGSGTTAQVVATPPGAVYTGLAISGTGATSRLYAANFAAGTIDMFDNGFSRIFGGFVDSSLPSGYTPFNVQTLGGSVFVAYAFKDAITHEETKGAGLGVVDEYDLAGTLIRRFTTFGSLDAPWGFAQAPAGFGIFANALLIGNFGDGTIHAFNRTTGAELGVLRDVNGVPLVNEGLWGISFGNGGTGGSTNDLYFAAGIDDEAHGLFGTLAVTTTPEPASLALMAAGLGVVLVGVRRRRARG